MSNNFIFIKINEIYRLLDVLLRKKIENTQKKLMKEKLIAISVFKKIYNFKIILWRCNRLH